MRTSLLRNATVIAMMLTLAVSCNDEPVVGNYEFESQYRQMIGSYFSQLQQKNDEEKKRLVKLRMPSTTRV